MEVKVQIETLLDKTLIEARIKTQILHLYKIVFIGINLPCILKVELLHLMTIVAQPLKYKGFRSSELKESMDSLSLIM